MDLRYGQAVPRPQGRFGRGAARHCGRPPRHLPCSTAISCASLILWKFWCSRPLLANIEYTSSTSHRESSRRFRHPYSDIEGCEFTACVFTGVSFNVADISSSNFQNCIFSDCKFFSANLLDNGFLRCTFSMCLVEGATVNTNLFEHSRFTQFCPEDSALYSNEFYHCVFKESRLLTSIYYTIFYKCSFFACEIDSYIFGFQFGLKQNQLNKMFIQHFGASGVGLSFALNALHVIYSDRQLKIEDLTLNFIKYEALGTTMMALIHDFIAMIHAGYIIKVDEIKFLRRIINFTYQNKLIPRYFYVLMAKDIFSIKSDILPYFAIIFNSKTRRNVKNGRNF